METSNTTAPIITIIHPDIVNLNTSDAEEVKIVDENDLNQKSTEDGKPTTPQGNEDEKKEDDRDSVLIEEVQNKTIELDDDSVEEVALNLDHDAEEISNVVNDSSTKTTEFVAVNAANISSAEITNDTEPTNRYPIEDIQIKDELAEAITADLNANDVLENDPMDLLEVNNRSESTSSTRSQGDMEDYGDDVSSAGSSSVKTGSSSSVSFFDWIKEYTWLLYEEGDEPFGYCLYCDAKLNIKSQRSVKQHGFSLYHKERRENYLAFREEEEKNGLSMKLVEIKDEFGTDSRVEALKLKRKSQSGALNNFNWRRWLEDYPWLERDSTEGTVGYCKYCVIHVNVEFSYLRDRHQEGVKHREAEKQYQESIKSSEPIGQNNSINDNEEKEKDSSVDSNQTKSQKWLEPVKNEPSMVRCKICRSKMFKNNFLRHLSTNLHAHNEKLYLQSQKASKKKSLDEESTKSQQNWNLYVKHHPWLVSDPADSSFAYCKYCEKRIIYGASAVKRALHENSSQHKQNESEFKKQTHKDSIDKDTVENATDKEGEQKNADENAEKTENEDEDQDHNDEAEEENEEEADNESDDEENEEGDDEEEEEGEDEEDDEEEDEERGEESEKQKESGDENDSKKRVYRLTEEWINQYAWCKRYNKDPTNFIYCIYCKIPLRVASSRIKHQATALHTASEKEFLSRQAKKQKMQRKENNETSTFFEWAIPMRNNSSSYSCRYCRVRISKNYSKKQHASSKIHQINESIYKNNRKSLRSDENPNSSQQAAKVVTQLAKVTPSKKLQTFAKVVIKAPSTVTLIKQLQKKFPWLSYKRSELRSNYGHCKICDISLYIRSLKHVLRHLRSQRHINIIKEKKKQKVEKEQEDEGEGEGEDISTKVVKRGPKEESQTSPPPDDTVSQNQTKPMTTTATVAKTTSSIESPKAFNYKSTIAEMKNRFSWIEKSERPNYVLCRFCNTNIPLKVLFLRNHSNSQKHRHYVVNYRSNGGKKVAREPQGPNNRDRDNGKSSNNGEEDEDVMIVEENNEEILISEQDENWTVKSETMDEHEELDFLLQRSFNSSQNKSNTQRNVRKSINAEDDPPTKRIKRSQSFRRLNDNNTSLVASLLTTPLTLASCLGPLIQQQIQQQANISQTSLTNTNLSTSMDISGAHRTASAPPMSEPENTYDLFFKSISETMKKLPVDLAAEGKLRVMQIICDLELQALKRQQSVSGESAPSNTSGGLSYQPTSNSIGINPGYNSSVTNDINSEQNGNGNETIITPFNISTDMSSPSATNLIPTVCTNSSVAEKAGSSSSTSPIIGVMDKNGLQTIQLKTSVSKQIPRNTTTTTITTAANPGIRCIPFKNLSQPATPDTQNTKITRIQVPISVTTQPSNPNAVNTSKNLLNFRNIQITKRIAAASTAASPVNSVSGPLNQQTASQTSTMVNKSPQRTYIASIQPQLQRWGCSVNGAAPQHTPTSSAVNHIQQLPTQQTSTPISKKH